MLTQAGGGQQACPGLHLLRMGQEGREGFSLVLFHTTFPEGPRSPSAVTVLPGKCLCLILMQPINQAASLHFVHLGRPMPARVSLSYYSPSIQEALLTHPLPSSSPQPINIVLLSPGAQAAAIPCVPLPTQRGINLSKDKLHPPSPCPKPIALTATRKAKSTVERGTTAIILHWLTRKKVEKEEEEKGEHRCTNTRSLGRKGAGSKGGSQTIRVPLLMPSAIGPTACLLSLLAAGRAGVCFFTFVFFFPSSPIFVWLVFCFLWVFFSYVCLWFLGWFFCCFFLVTSGLQFRQGGLEPGKEG